MCAVTLLIVVHDTLLLTHLEAQGLIVQDFILGPGHCVNVQTVCSTCELHVLVRILFWSNVRTITLKEDHVQYG